MGEFAELIRSRRLELRRTLRDVAGEATISVPFLSDIEWGRRVPSETSVVVAISSALGLDPELMLRHAAASREGVELKVPEGDALREQAAAVLARSWDDDAAVRAAMDAVLERRDSDSGRST